MQTLELHSLCSCFPPIVGEEFEALKSDIARFGLEEPIVTLEGKILDGGNRYRACRELGIEPTLRAYAGNDPAQYVLSKNFLRRHLTPAQRSVIVSLMADWTAAATQGGDRRSNQSATLHSDRCRDRAVRAEVSERTQKSADKVVKKAPEMARQVARGEISLPEAVRSIEAPTTGGGSTSLVDRLKAEVADLSARLRDAEEAAAEAGSIAQDLVAFSDGAEAKRMRDLATQLKAVEATRDKLLTENAQLKREIKRLNKKLGTPL